MLNRLLKGLLSLAASPAVLFYWAHVLLRASRERRRGKTIIFSYSQVAWDEVWQRPQEFAWRAAVTHPVVYCSPVQIHNWLFTLGKRWKAVQISTEGRDLVILSPLVFSGHYRSRFIFRLNCMIIASQVKSWLRGCEVASISNSPFAEPVTQRLFFSGTRYPRLVRSSYDVIDDFPAFEWAPPSAWEMENRQIGYVDSIMTGTFELMKQHRVGRPDAEFIPCGVDFDAFSATTEEPEDLRGLARPIIGYFGSISERVDMQLLGKIAVTFPHASLVLIGPVHLSESQTPRAPNIHYLGLKPHDLLPAYAQRFDVGLIPFRITPATLKLNPVKTLEYLAAGVPVVSSAIPDVEHFFGEIVTIAHNDDEFIGAIRRILGNPDSDRREKGINLARSCSWEEMTTKMLRLIAP